ncbi:MAG: cysteine protease [Deltaproteobacteria bacterium RBG_16_54_11]|jgi:C1A family cysteine protease|nr:MAG: cysteine protease [Deltaproteobacteria bacterium RBG_16_54_11]
MAEQRMKRGLGWLPDYPDFRDYTMEQDNISHKLKQLGQKDSVKGMLKKIGVSKSSQLQLPGAVDLRAWCSPIEDQDKLGSCTAHAGVGIVEYFERRAFNKHIDASRLFLYKVTRNLLNWTGDTGAFLRTTMEAMVLFGVPPEEYWHYDITDLDKEPSAFLYAFAQNYQTISYYRLDPPETPHDLLLTRIKTSLAVGLPAMFGFSVYSSIEQAEKTGAIPYPISGEKLLGGHAVVAVGYDEKMNIKNSNPGAHKTTGGLLIRNSWGTGWGEEGYGWLPYEYVQSGLAIDWWSLLKNEWVDTGEFKF